MVGYDRLDRIMDKSIRPKQRTTPTGDLTAQRVEAIAQAIAVWFGVENRIDPMSYAPCARSIISADPATRVIKRLTALLGECAEVVEKARLLLEASGSALLAQSTPSFIQEVSFVHTLCGALLTRLGAEGVKL